MIIEMRTYTLQPGTVTAFEERFGQALPARAKVCSLAYPASASTVRSFGPIPASASCWRQASSNWCSRVRSTGC